jgi:hypothetical protein
VQRDGERVSGDVTGEVSRVHRRYPGRFDDRFVPAPWETPVQLSANVDVKVVDGLSVLGSWQGEWHRPWALRQAYYDYARATGSFGAADLGTVNLDRPGAQRLAPYSRLDAGVRAERTLGGVTLSTRIQVLNVLDRANAFDASLDPPTGARVPRTLPGRRLYVSLQMQLPGGAN